MELSSLIFIKPHRNFAATFYALFILILFFSLILFEPNYHNSSSSNFTSVSNTLFTILWFLVLLSIIWTYKIAKQTGRNVGLWILFGFIFGPISLLIISLKDYKINDPNIVNIINQVRKEYKAELKNKGNFESAEEIANKYKTILKENVVKIITSEKINSLKDLIETGVIDNNVDIKDKESIIKIIEQNKLNDSELKEWSKEWTKDEKLCPACGHQIDNNVTFCYNCGLRVK